MFEIISKSLVENRFIVVKTGFEVLDLSTDMKQVILSKRDSDICARMLFHFPDFFVYPRDLPPEIGCFFGVLAQREESLPQTRRDMFEEHFPCDRLVLFRENPRESIECRWYTDSKWIALAEFINYLKNAKSDS